MHEIAPAVFQIPLMPRNAINCYLIDDVLVDAGIKSSSKKILKALKGHEVSKHVLTHAHADHQGASKDICTRLGIPLLTSEIERDNAESGHATRNYPERDSLIARFQQKFWAGPGHKVDQTLKEGDRVGSFEVVDTPGHAPGHISFFRRADGVLIAGDALVNMNLLTTIVGLGLPPAAFTTDQQQNIQSIKKLYALKPKIICFGHGPVLRDMGKFNAFVRKLP
ncbi:MBL fold metallo-hydrolase [Maritalea mediterranea]|uniref:MBL fold metallo-hydrolase n=1 Tax=Maritalea mediterranea TaxID=2909667 RepID=A0ABS9E7H6_9HYPH|nr:MBL fold metallo-hydrolase [Maritalea mediterranea]MCF4097725.1 MBL fold metallo-hydrolase [Maritalea mediterranea]